MVTPILSRTRKAPNPLTAFTGQQLADEAGRLHDALDAVKAEAVRRGLRTAEGEDWRISLSPPGEQNRTDKARLLQVLGITAAEFTARFTRLVHTDWRLTITRRRKFEAAA